MKISLTRSQSALAEIGILFLPGIPAYLWLWPLADSHPEWSTPIQSVVYVYFIACTLFIGLRRWNWDQIGINRQGIGFSLACGAVLIAARTMALLSTDIPLAWQLTTLDRLIGDVVFYFLLVGVGEELLFRGVMWRALEEWRGTRWAIWVTTLGFGIWHIYGRGIAGIAVGILFGMFFGAIRWRAGGIVGLIVAHALMDLSAVAIVPDLSMGYLLTQVRVVHSWLAISTEVTFVALLIYLWKAPTSFSILKEFYGLLRLNRSSIVALLTGASAFAADAGIARSLWMMFAGWCLAVGGFSLDFYADRDLDLKEPRAKIRRNPFANGTLSLRTGLVFSTTFIVVSFVLTAVMAPLALLPWIIILGIIIGLALHVFETPITRALTLGLLQALYVLMGSAAGTPSPALIILAVMFFFAMFGGRGLIDIRDYPQDEPTPVQTLPKRYGIPRTAQFTAICLLISYALSIAAYFAGEFGTIYLYLVLIFVAVGIVCVGLFVARPSPRLAYILTLVFMAGAGALMCVAMVLGHAWK